MGGDLEPAGAPEKVSSACEMALAELGVEVCLPKCEPDPCGWFERTLEELCTVEASGMRTSTIKTKRHEQDG